MYWQLGNQRVKVSHKVSALTLSITEDNLVSYDLAGRFLGSYAHGTNIRRGLDNSFQQRWRAGQSKATYRRHRLMPMREAKAHLENCRIQICHLLDDTIKAKKYPATAEVLRLAADFTYDRLVDDAKTFARIYGHVPILPPDQYRALVIQATDGCTYNRCTFCTLYRDKAFLVRSLTGFRCHIQQVLDFMGASLTYRTSIFLGDANAIAIATPRLVKFIKILRDTENLNPIINRGGIHAFLDIYTGTHKSVQEYHELKNLGLRRISLGVESGNKELLTFIRKQGNRDEIIKVTRTLKSAGVAVNIIFMVGLGGNRYREVHLNDSASLLGKLPLDESDIIYLSQFNPDKNAPYITKAHQSGINIMSADELDPETDRWKSVLSRTVEKTGPKVVPYSFQRFIY